MTAHEATGTLQIPVYMSEKTQLSRWSFRAGWWLSERHSCGADFTFLL